MRTIDIKRKGLQEWIAEALLDTDKEHPECTGITLVHIVNGEAQKEIHSVKFGKGKGAEPYALYKLFHGKATAYAQDLPGVQTFQLMAFYNSEEPLAFQPFSVAGSLNNNGLGTEAPDEKGLRQQTMRWNDAVLAQTYRQQEALNAAMARVIDLQNKHIEVMSGRYEKAAEDNQKAIELLQTVMIEKESKHHEFQMQQLQYARSTQERQAYMKLLPAVANQILGREVFPQGTQDTALLEMIADNLPVEEVMRLAEKMPPEVVGVIFSRFSGIIEKKQKEAQIKQLEQEGRKEAMVKTDGLS